MPQRQEKREDIGTDRKTTKPFSKNTLRNKKILRSPFISDRTCNVAFPIQNRMNNFVFQEHMSIFFKICRFMAITSNI
ncbi:hypothetical protein BGC30_07330 [Novacetimonas hansenii]|nr:hypothetical protein BGC30_07330 [Novacetimonas hansenii]